MRKSWESAAYLMKTRWALATQNYCYSLEDVMHFHASVNTLCMLFPLPGVPPPSQRTPIHPSRPCSKVRCLQILLDFPDRIGCPVLQGIGFLPWLITQSASPWILEMQIIGPCPRPTESETPRTDPQSVSTAPQVILLHGSFQVQEPGAYIMIVPAAQSQSQSQSQRRALQGKLSPLSSHGSWNGTGRREEKERSELGDRVLVPPVLQSLAE
ncbi:uncharacterized protein LOC116860052 [Lontra canadensis]|uniref:uncharacterized protein LOC116860052 n=1 Tax=Lontra canadensis TaxID=76717 RepID=UPI0013F35027|nr:uncharacterized protein LOC116860052 [Lontra canadensis]